MHVTGRLMIASVGSTIAGSVRSSNRMSRAPYNTAPCISHLSFVHLGDAWSLLSVSPAFLRARRAVGRPPRAYLARILGNLGSTLNGGPIWTAAVNQSLGPVAGGCEPARGISMTKCLSTFSPHHGSSASRLDEKIS
jgi:hypothetical protein